MTLPPRLLSLMRLLPEWGRRVLLVMLCWQCAGLFWSVAAPSTGNVDLVMPASSRGLAAASKESLLGWYGSSESKVSADTGGDYQLIAVIAGRSGAAIFRDGSGKHLAVRAGEDIVPGIRLLSVAPDQAIIERGGARKTLALVQNAKVLDIQVSAPKNSASSAPATLRLTRGQMLAMMQGDNIARWDQGFAALPEGGIRVDNADSHPLSRMLKLKNGDILKSVNRQKLDNLADISLLLHSIGQHSVLELSLVRNGTSLTQRYDIKP